MPEHHRVMNNLHTHFQHIHTLIQQGKTRALAAATAHALESYWLVGAYLSQVLSENTYGKNVVNHLIANYEKRSTQDLRLSEFRQL